MQNKKRFFASLFIILFIAIFMLIFAYEKKDQLVFNRYVNTFTKNTLSENALDLHYTLKTPTNYGIYDAAPLPIYQSKDALIAYDNFKNLLFYLQSIIITHSFPTVMLIHLCIMRNIYCNRISDIHLASSNFDKYLHSDTA